MKISIQWLNEFVQTKGSSDDISDILTMLGLEAESLPDLSGLDDIVIGEVRDCSKHPNADRLNICKVFDGKDELPIVCGAPNVRKGQKIALAPVGAILPGDFKISKAKIRGEISQGMICSEKELGISQEHEGIMVLEDRARPGESFQEFFNEKNAIELDITPNRADCFSHLGVARDYSVKMKEKLNFPSYSIRSFKNNKASEHLTINIEDPNDCPRYIAGIVDNVNVKNSPKWLREKLESVGHRSINNIVDISNLVMLEMGQPTHMFDAEKIDSKEILIRRGLKNESIVTLDGIKRSISSDELLITNGKNPIAVAGIMGGLASSVTDQTTRVIIESAYFEPTIIRKGAKSLNMSTDASKRFERGADPNGAEFAFWRIVSLLEELADGTWIEGLIDAYPKKIPSIEIKLRKTKLDKVSGFSIDNDFVINTLKSLGCIIKENDKGWLCQPPSWRPDLVREIDLIEEIIRVYGYDNVISNYNSNISIKNSVVDPLSIVDNINNILNGFGFYQVFNNTLQSEKNVSFFESEPVSIMNPLSDKMSHLRTSLIEGLLFTADFNFKNGQKNMMLFEHGNIFRKNGEGLDGINEIHLISGVVCGNMHDSSIHLNKSIKNDLFSVKGTINSLLKRMNFRDVSLESVDKSESQFDKAFIIKVNNKNIGRYGKISSSIIKKLDFDIREIYGFEINLKDLLSLISTNATKYEPINYLPKVERDLNFVVDETIEVGDIVKEIGLLKNKLLVSVVPKNIFRHSSIGDLKKSVTINLEFQHPSKTLEDKDVNLIIDEIINVVSKNFNAKLRQ